MIASGERMDFSALSRPTADKHSTGGVGDKITLPLAPLVAACGVAVPQLSGAGSATPAARWTSSSRSRAGGPRCRNEEMLRPAARRRRGRSARPGDGLAPADKKLYALRDVTGTVEAIPLIASSIMCKKIAEGTGALVLDVKVGSGAFMKDVERRARAGPHDGRPRHRRRRATRSRCSPTCTTPLGLTAGNALEVRESVEVLAGGGPADVVELTLALAREMLAARRACRTPTRRRRSRTARRWTSGAR